MAGRQLDKILTEVPPSSAKIGTSVLVPSYASDDDIAGVLPRTQLSAIRIRRRIVSRAECGESSARRNCHRGTGVLGQYPPNCVQVASEAAALLQAQSSVRFKGSVHWNKLENAVWEHGGASSAPVAAPHIMPLYAAAAGHIEAIILVSTQSRSRSSGGGASSTFPAEYETAEELHIL